MLIASIIGTLTGGLTSILPGVLSYFQRRDELQHEQKILELRGKYAKQDTELQIDLINTNADANEGESLRRHDANLDGNGFIGALRRSVRPVITYLFFILYVFIKVVAVITAYQTAGAENTAGLAVLWSDILPVIWTEQDAAIFGAIIGFWFGGRAIEKLMRR
jgi:hypothetical protein